MSQQFRIESESLRDKINSLLPSQARGAIDVDLTGSTTIIPIVDLTETAEGSNLRQDLQTSFSLTSCTAFAFTNATQTIINTTGFYRVFGCNTLSAAGSASFNLTDGFTNKLLLEVTFNSGGDNNDKFDFIVFLAAGDSLTCTASNTSIICRGVTRQIADINGNLINPV